MMMRFEYHDIDEKHKGWKKKSDHQNLVEVMKKNAWKIITELMKT